MRRFRQHLKGNWPLYLFLIGVWPALQPLLAAADQQALELKGPNPFLRMIDTGTGQVYELMNNAGALQIRDVTASTPRFSITTTGAGPSDFALTISGAAFPATPQQYNRTADGNWVLNVNAATTTYVQLGFPEPFRTTAGKGTQITGLTLSETITSTALASHTLTCNTTTYTNNVAVSPTSVPITVTLPTAATTNPYLTVATITTPGVMATDNTLYSCDLKVQTNAGGSYTLNSVTYHYTQVN